MERVDCSDDDGEVDVELGVGVLPRELDGRLIGFRATVAEEGLGVGSVNERKEREMTWVK